MRGLAEEIRQKFQKSLHVCRQSEGYFNGIWSDMMIETTLMKFGSSPGGLVGITLKPNSVTRWAYSFHKLSQMIKDIKELHDTSTSKGKIKEEEKGRIMTDLSDLTKIRQKLSVCIDPINETDGEFTKTIVNIATGKVTPEA